MNFQSIEVQPNIDQPMFMVVCSLLGIGILINLYYTFKRLKAKKLRLALVAGLNLVAFTVFLSLFLNISYQYNTHKALTIYTNTSGIFLADENIQIENKISIAELSNKLKHYQKLILNGNGLSEHQWNQLNALLGDSAFNNLNIEYTNIAPIQIGFKKASWPRSIIIGDSLDVQLTLAGPENIDEIFNVHFFDPYDELLDVQRAKLGDSISFTTVPVSQGNWLYKVAIYNQQENLLVSENISVYVSSGAKAKVLIVQSAPSFETRHLHNWLANQGSQIRIHSQISKDKFKQQIINPEQALENQSQDSLWQESLNWAEILVVDNRFLSQLADNDTSAIQAAIAEGLGLYLIADNKLVQNNWSSLLAPIENQINISTDALNKALFSWDKLKTQEPIDVLSARFESNSIIKDENGQGIVGMFEYGKGKLAIAMSQYSHSWRLAGNPQLHSQYWQHILKLIGKPRIIPLIKWEHTSLLDATKLIKQICFDNLQTEGLVSYRSPTTLEKFPARSADTFFEDRQCSLIEHEKAGWYEIKVSANNDSDAKSSGVRLYLDDKTSWKTLNQYKQITATQQRLITTTNNGQVSDKTYLSHLPIYLMLVFLFIGLWAEQRWFANQAT